MRVITPKNKKFDEGMRSLAYKAVSEDENSVTYEGVFGLSFSMAYLNMGYREFVDFCRHVKVIGGAKVRRGSTLFIKPLRKQFLSVRLTEDEFQDLKRCAELERLKPREFFREYLLRALAKRMELW